MPQKPKSSVSTIPLQTGRGLLGHVRDTYDAISRRAYQLFESRGGEHGHDQQDWLQAESELLQPFNADLKETREGYEVIVAVPGFALKDLSASLEENHLVIHGRCEQRERKKEGALKVKSQASREFLQVLALPEAVEIERGSAVLEGETLRISLPRSGETQKRRPSAA